MKLDSDEVMTIGYLARKGTTISKLGQKYLEEIAKYKDTPAEAAKAIADYFNGTSKKE